MNVLVACEESQEVCKAFRTRGHRAFSCDIQMCSGGHPEWHIQGDVLPLLNGNCTFQTADTHTHTSGEVGFNYCTPAMYLHQQRRGALPLSGWQGHIERRAVEERHRSHAFLSPLSVRRLRQDSDRKPHPDKGVLPTALHADYPAVDVWASCAEKDLFVAQRSAGTHAHRHYRGTAIKQNPRQLVQSWRQRTAEKQSKDLPRHSQSYGGTMGMI